MSNAAAATRLEEMLESAASDALETMCFFGVMGPLQGMPVSGERISARLTFQGDANGCLQATLDASAAFAIAANFLGEEAEDVARVCVDAVVCELANMICGALLSSYRKDGRFALSTPRITDPDDEQPDGAEPDGAVRLVLELETGVIALALDLARDMDAAL